MVYAGGLNSTVMGVFKPQKLASTRAFFPFLSCCLFLESQHTTCQKISQQFQRKGENVFVLCSLSSAFGWVPKWAVLVGILSKLVALKMLGAHHHEDKIKVCLLRKEDMVQI